MARFKELCLDTADEGRYLARFWAAVAGVRTAGDGDGGLDVVGDHEHQGVAICPVPEEKTVKNRVHLDVYARSVEDLVAMGARVETTYERWTVLTDPEGNELCCFERPELPSWRVHGIGVDSVDPEAQARWWAEAYAATARGWPGEDYWTVEHTTPDPVLSLDFAPVPEPKTVKNRLHWDVYGTAEEFLDRGATRLWEMPEWTVLADPEGNEFCVFPEPPA